MCQGLLPSRRHFEKREDPGDEVVLAVFSVNFNSLEDTFHHEMLSKSQQVFASAHLEF